MSANLPPKTPVSNWLENATIKLLKAGISSARLDAEIILSHTLLKSRTFLHAHPDFLLDSHRLDIADARLQLRIERTPIAYIVGHKDFYGRQFRVTPATLVPRPESEDIITLLKELSLPPAARLVDVGTGTGCLGITAKLELPHLRVTLLDISQHALTIARKNAEKLDANVTVERSDLLASYPVRADVILANLPYVDPTWEQSPELRHEPAMALFAEDNGLALIKKLLEQASDHLSENGYCILEADERQHSAIVQHAVHCNLVHVSTQGLALLLQKNK